MRQDQQATQTPKLEANFKIVLSDVEAWANMIMRKNVVLRTLFSYVIPALPVVFLLCLYSYDPDQLSAVLMAILVALPVGWFLFGKQLAVKQLAIFTARSYVAAGKSVGIFGNQTLTVTDTELIGTQEGSSEVERYRLSELAEVLETTNHLFIYVEPDRAHIVPKRDLDEATLGRLVSLFGCPHRWFEDPGGDALEQHQQPDLVPGAGAFAESQPAGMMAQLSHQPEGLQIVIPGRRSWRPLAGFLYLVVAGAFGLFDIRKTFHGDEMGLFFAAWLASIVIVLILFGKDVLWMLAGTETVRLKPGSPELSMPGPGIDPGVLVLRKAIFDIGRSRTFRLTEISNLRVNPTGLGGLEQHMNTRGLRRRGGLMFEHRNEIVRFATEVSDDEAAYLLHKLEEHIPARCRADC